MTLRCLLVSKELYGGRADRSGMQPRALTCGQQHGHQAASGVPPAERRAIGAVASKRLLVAGFLDATADAAFGLERETG